GGGGGGGGAGRVAGGGGGGRGPAGPPAGFRQAERPAWDRDAIPQPPAEPDEEQDRDERPGGEAAGPRRDRVVPRYVEDLAGGGGQREPEREQAGADDRARADVPPGTDREPAEAGTPRPGAHGGGGGRGAATAPPRAPGGGGGPGGGRGGRGRGCVGCGSGQRRRRRGPGQHRW